VNCTYIGNKEINPCPSHYPLKITFEQHVIMKKFIRKREKDKKNLFELGEVCEFIKTTFEIIEHVWINIIVKKYSRKKFLNSSTIYR
jgi:hypothetical protein